MTDLVTVYISPTIGEKEISWEETIRGNNAPLAGYLEDLNNSSINDVLLSILNIKEEPKDNEGNIIWSHLSNYIKIKGLYTMHITNLQFNLDFDDDEGWQNLEKESQAFGESPSLQAVDIILKYGILPGIELFIPYEKTLKYYKDIMGEDKYITGEKEEIYSNKNKSKGYYEYLTSEKDFIQENENSIYTDIKSSVQVVIYSKSKSQAYDITNFISQVTTSMSVNNGGNFQIKMHLISQKELINKAQFQDNNLSIKGYTKALLLQSIFRENDLVFIRFEKLKCEKNIENKLIKGKYWDLIGLIDTTPIISDYDSLEINITGRDLIKLLIEDNSYFIPLQWANTPETMFGGDNTKIYKRLFSTGEYNLEFTKSFKSIENSIGFILSQLTNIQVLSDSCLDFLEKEYGKELNKSFKFTPTGKEEQELPIKGIWGIVDYVVDKTVSNLTLADASLKDPNGSILQQILKICQNPFVEVIFDTYIDRYTLLIRRPPFTMKDIQESRFIFVGKESSLNDSLNFSKEVYTIYQLNPTGGCFANQNSIALSYLPWIVLDEYTKLWGNKLYSQSYNYMDIDSYSKSINDNEKNKKENFIEDLIWLIESTVYLPFSRTGTITLKGDRRIKVGHWIYYEKSNEVFYVEGVAHSASIQEGKILRITTLNVSRGLVIDYIKSPNKNTTQNEEKSSVAVSNVSYEDIVDTDLLRKGLKELFVKMNRNFNLHREVKDKDTIKGTSSIVISEVFNFFLSGAQFERIIKPYILYYNNSAITIDEINFLKGKNSSQKGNSNTLKGYEEKMLFEDNTPPSNENNSEKRKIQTIKKSSGERKNLPEIKLIFRRD